MNRIVEKVASQPPLPALPAETPAETFKHVKAPPDSDDQVAHDQKYKGTSFNPYTFVEKTMKDKPYKSKALAVLQYILSEVNPQVLFISSEAVLYVHSQPLVQQAPLAEILQSLVDRKRNRVTKVAAGEMAVLNVLSTAPGTIKNVLNPNKLKLFEPDTLQMKKTDIETNYKIHKKAMNKALPNKTAAPLATVSQPFQKVRNVSGFRTVTPVVKPSMLITHPDERNKWYYMN